MVREIKANFPTCVSAEGVVDRAVLGKIVFGDEKRRKVLNNITHKRIFYSIAWQIFYHRVFRFRSLVALDAPLLFETHLDMFTNPTVVVHCRDTNQQRQRLMARDKITAAEADKKIESQMSIEKKKGLADVKVDNSGTEESLKR